MGLQQKVAAALHVNNAGIKKARNNKMCKCDKCKHKYLEPNVEPCESCEQAGGDDDMFEEEE